MVSITAENVKGYLERLLSKPVAVLSFMPLRESDVTSSAKQYGYGTPLRVDYLADGHLQTSVLHTLSPGPFGHEHMADRAQVLLWESQAFNRLPRQVRALDVGGFQSKGEMVSLGKIDEFFLLTEYVEGQGYFKDLTRLAEGGELTEVDLARADALCDYLVGIHSVRGSDPGLYVRRIRELIGHGECIMGVADSYPCEASSLTTQLLQHIEHQCVTWRWKLKTLTHRLRQVHGDFHPWNILFGPGIEFRLLDRSRGEYGEPADDLVCLTLNYLFSSLQSRGRLEGGLESLFWRFWDRYLDKSGDTDMLRVVAPFFAFRGLVMASPMWYPALSEDVRQKLFTFITAVLEAETFDPGQMDRYCGTEKESTVCDMDYGTASVG
jgi:Phosphotransferase enzyme family